MIHAALRRAALAGVAAIVVGSSSAPVKALVVFDPWNYAQNILTAARTLDEVNKQIQSLQNQAQMLINQGKNLASLPYSSLQSIEQTFQQTQQLLGQAQRIAYDVQQIESRYQSLYPQSYTGSTSSLQLIANAQERWKNSVAAFEDSLKVQAGVVQGLDTTRIQATALVSASQSATGALQAAQAGNQLIALQTRQLADLTAVVAAQARAQALEAARTTANDAAAKEQLNRFLTTGQGYQSQPVQMFHQ